MRWVTKAAMANVLSTLPGGGHIYYFVQRHVTRTLPTSEEKCRSRIESAIQHLQAFHRFGSADTLDDCVFLEFGAGWDLAIPLFFRTAGVGRQLLFDRESLARALLVRTSAERVRRFAAQLGGQTWQEFPVRGERLPS